MVFLEDIFGLKSTYKNLSWTSRLLSFMQSSCGWSSNAALIPDWLEASKHLNVLLIFSLEEECGGPAAANDFWQPDPTAIREAKLNNRLVVTCAHVCVCDKTARVAPPPPLPPPPQPSLPWPISFNQAARLPLPFLPWPLFIRSPTATRVLHYAALPVLPSGRLKGATTPCKETKGRSLKERRAGLNRLFY